MGDYDTVDWVECQKHLSAVLELLFPPEAEKSEHIEKNFEKTKNLKNNQKIEKDRLSEVL